ncbi:MAG: hypothetical protein K2H84_04530 [Paramuribaculum sp.]|nr:hypothetical protein [Paramuribaculum sp.]
MKRVILLFIGVFSLLSFASCEEEDSPLMFSVEDVDDSENVRLEYYSVDPHCIPKSYYIKSNSRASEITIKCTNANSLFIDENIANQEYVCTDGHWWAEIAKSNTVIFHFDEIEDNPDEEIAVFYGGFNVCSQTKKGVVKTYITVKRINKPITDPFYFY